MGLWNRRLLRTRSLGTFAVALLAAMALAVGVSPSPASADARSCAWYGTVTIGGYTVPSGTYCVSVIGSGRWVQGVSGDVYAPNVCNYDTTAEFFTNNWTWKKTVVSGHNYNCAYGTVWTPYIPINNSISNIVGTSTGYVCSTLRVGWRGVASRCFYVY